MASNMQRARRWKRSLPPRRWMVAGMIGALALTVGCSTREAQTEETAATGALSIVARPGPRVTVTEKTALVTLLSTC